MAFLRFALAAVLLAGSALPLPAQASNDGALCSGLGKIICAPIAIAESLKPKSAQDQLQAAIAADDAEGVRRRLQRGTDMPAPTELLTRAAISYLSQPDPDRLRVVTDLLAHGADVSGEQGTPHLQMTVSHYSYVLKPPQERWPHRIALARLLLAHGARATAVQLGDCYRCDVDNGFLPLLIAGGADPNRSTPASPVLLERLLREDRFDAAERLVQLGADPNGRAHRRRSMLSRLADGCDLQRLRARLPAERFEASAAACTAEIVARTTFAVRRLGADPDGQASPATDCVTPHETARDLGNDRLADALAALGASPDRGARCRAARAVE